MKNDKNNHCKRKQTKSENAPLASSLVSHHGRHVPRLPMRTLSRPLLENALHLFVQERAQPIAMVSFQGHHEGMLRDSGLGVFLGAEVKQELAQLLRWYDHLRCISGLDEDRQQVPDVIPNIGEGLACEVLEHQW